MGLARTLWVMGPIVPAASDTCLVRGRWRVGSLEQFVDRGGAGGVELGEAFGEFAALALTISFETDKVGHTDASVAADAMGGDVSVVKELIEVRSAHLEAKRNLVRSQLSVAPEDCDVVAFGDNVCQAKQQVTQVRGREASGEVAERIKLSGGNIGCLHFDHVGHVIHFHHQCHVSHVLYVSQVTR